MTTQQAIRKLQKEFNINAIYAKHILAQGNTKKKLLEDVKKLIKEKPKPFIDGSAVFFNLLPQKAVLSDLEVASRFIFLNRKWYLMECIQ